MISGKQIEQCILEVAGKFRQGTVNFRIETSFQCPLFSCLREKQAPITSKKYEAGIELVHVEFPTAENSRERHDLVILTTDSARKFERLYGEKVGIWAKKMRLRAVFEIKFRSCDLQYDEEIKKDISRLKRVQKRKIAAYSYLLIFIDREVDWNETSDRKICRVFERNTKKSPGLEVYCIPGKRGDILRIKSGASKRIEI